MASSSMRSQVKLLEGSNFCMSLRDYLALGQRVNAAGNADSSICQEALLLPHARITAFTCACCLQTEA